MNRVQRDLENHRYRNALRSREETLEALRQSRLHLAGEIDVTSDPSAAMPKHVRKDIADAMSGKLPAEYSEALEQYYRRLSDSSAGADLAD